MTLVHLLAFLILSPLLFAALRRLLSRRAEPCTNDRAVGGGRSEFRTAARVAAAMLLAVVLARCAYSIGTRERQIPGGYRLVSVPVFKNGTAEVGAEVAFTNAMIRELERSKLAKVVDKHDAEVVVLGTVESVKYLATNSQIICSGINGANYTNCVTPTPGYIVNNVAGGIVQNTEYRILVTTDLKLQRLSDERILWQGKFSGERTYLAPNTSILGLNSANAPYNQSAREQNIALMSTDIMIEAYERMTENF